MGGSAESSSPTWTSKVCSKRPLSKEATKEQSELEIPRFLETFQKVDYQDPIYQDIGANAELC